MPLETGTGESLEQLKRACKMNDGKRCVVLGIKASFLEDYQKARKYFDKACKLNVASGSLSSSYQKLLIIVFYVIFM